MNENGEGGAPGVAALPALANPAAPKDGALGIAAASPAAWLRWLAALAVFASLGAAFRAQFLYTGEVLTRWRDSVVWAWTPDFSRATIFLCVACGLAALAARWISTRTELDRHTVFVAIPARHSVLLPAILGGLATLLYAIRGETSVVRLLWAGGLSVLVALLLLNHVPDAGQPFGLLEIAGLGTLTAVGFWLRFYQLATLPEHTDNDVALMGAHTLDLMDKGDPRFFGLYASDHLLSFHQILALGMRLFGKDHEGLVITSVLAGTATIPALYLLGRELFGRTAAGVAAALLTVSYTHYHFSRILFGPLPTLLLTLGLALLFRGFRTGAPLHLAGSGVLCGLALHTYYSGRVGPVILLVLLIASFTIVKRDQRPALKAWGWALPGGAIAFGPMLAYMLADPQVFAGRGNEVALWNPRVWEHSMAKYHATSAVDVLIGQVRSSFLTFHLYGDGSPHFAFPRPMVSSLTAALAVLGLGVAVTRLRSLAYLLPVAWLVLTLVLGGVITSDPPYWPHLNIVLPAVMLLAGAGARLVVEALSGIAPASRFPLLALLATLIALTGFQNWFVYVSYASGDAGPRVASSRFLRRLPSDTRVYVASDITSWNEFAFRFWNRDKEGRDLRGEERDRLELPVDRPFIVLLFENEEILPRLQEKYPDGITRVRRDATGKLLNVFFVNFPGGGFHPVKATDPPSRAKGWTVVAAAAGIWLAGLVWMRRRAAAISTQRWPRAQGSPP